MDGKNTINTTTIMKRVITFAYFVILLMSLPGCQDHRLDGMVDDRILLLRPDFQKVEVYNIGTHEVDIPVIKGGIGVQEADVSFALNVKLLTDYNEQHKTSYKLLPEDHYVIPQKQLHIAAEDPRGLLKIIFNTEKISQLDNIRNYVLPLSMTVSEGIKVVSGRTSVLIMPNLTGGYVGFETSKQLWFGESDQLGLSVNENSVATQGEYIISSRTGLMYNRFTGAKVDSKLNMNGIIPGSQPVAFFLTNDQAGNLIGCTLSALTNGIFAVYKWDHYDSDPIEVLRYTANSGQYGRKLVVVGDINKNAYVITSRTTTDEHLRWKISEGMVVNAGNPDVLQTGMIQSNTAGLQMVAPADTSANASFYFSNPPTKEVKLMNENGDAIDINGPLLPDDFPGPTGWGTGATSSIYHITAFDFNNGNYLAVLHSTVGHDPFRYYISILDLNNSYKTVFSKYVENIGTNTNGTGSITYRVSDDKKSVHLYAFMTQTGVVCYELTKADMTQ